MSLHSVLLASVVSVIVCLLSPVEGVPKLKKIGNKKHILILDSHCPCDSLSRDSECGCADGLPVPSLRDPAANASTATVSTPNNVSSDNIVETPQKSGTFNMTDLALLTIYKGNDMSDRVGIADYGDLVNDYRQGWSLWPSSTVWYLVDPSVGDCERSVVSVAVGAINQATTPDCVTLIPLSSTPPVTTPVLHVTTSGEGCFASLGYRSHSEVNVVNIGTGCINVGTVMHLFLHALGMLHEHQRPDRDDFVQIVSTNVNSMPAGKFASVFSKMTGSANEWSNAATARSYDYDSVMHNGPCHYSTAESLGGSPGNDGCTTAPSMIAAPMPGMEYTGNSSRIGNRQFLSVGDQKTLSAMYQCSERVALPQLDSAVTVTTETTMCMLNDASGFAWSANAEPLSKSISAAEDTTAVASTTTTGPTTQNDAFRDFFANRIKNRLFWIILAGVCGGLFIVAVAAYGLYKRRKSRGIRSAIEEGNGGNDGGAHVPLLGNTVTLPAKLGDVGDVAGETAAGGVVGGASVTGVVAFAETGDSTDSEIYEEILNGNFSTSTSPPVARPIVPQSTVDTRARLPTAPVDELV